MSLKRALNWAEAGWPVFPVRENKKPYFSDWQEVATTNRATIEKWWEPVPAAEVGVVPGMVECHVLDVDVKNGKPGYESLKTLEEEYNFKAEDFPSQATPSGGKHYFFKGYLPTSSDTLGAGIDTRGGLEDGSSRGYALAYQDTPPSTVAACKTGPAFRLGNRERTKADATPLVEEDENINVERAKGYLRGITGVAEGSRGITLFKHAATLKDLGIGLEKALELLAEFPAALGDPPQDAEEAYGRIASAYRNGQLQPGIAAINPTTIAALASEEKSKGFAPRKRLNTWPEIRNRPEAPWLVRNLIPGKSLVGMYGAGGSYKSFLAGDIALAISMGYLEWGGEDILTHGPVVIVSGEGSQGPRVRAWEQKHASVGDNFAVLDGIDLSDPDDIVAAAREIDQAVEEKWAGRKPVLLVVDTLARASGSADENSNKDMGRIVAACDELRRHFDCTVLLVHHTPKSGHEWRGATAVYFALDAALSVKRVGDKRLNMEVARMKDGDIGQRWAVNLEEVGTGRDRQGEPETSLVVKRAAIMQEKSEDKGRKLETAQEARGRMLETAKIETARGVLRDLLPDQTLSSATLAKHVAAAMAAMGGTGDTEGTRALLNKAVLRTSEGKRLNTEHPLADCVVTLDPLAFGQAKEKTLDISTEGLPS